VQTLINKNQSLQNIDKTHAVLKIRKLKAANIYVCGLCHYLHKIYIISISIITEYILNTFLQNSGPGRGLLLGVLLPLKFRLSECEGYVAISDHVLDLSLHGDAEKCNEVHH